MEFVNESVSLSFLSSLRRLQSALVWRRRGRHLRRGKVRGVGFQRFLL